MAEAGSFTDRVKQQADIVRVVGEYVRLKKLGQNFTGLCPFHSEKTPSFAVHPVKQIYHCFGCGAGGSFADRGNQQADIVRVVGEYVRLKKSGQNFTGLCPFHSEKTRTM